MPKPIDERPIIIYTPGFNYVTGGIIVLHKLAKLLTMVRKNVFLSYWPGMGDSTPFGIPTFNLAGQSGDSGRTWLAEDCIVICSETIGSNPLRSKRVVRWLLCTPGFFGGPTSFSPKELIVSQHPSFSRIHYPDAPILCIHEIFKDFIYPGTIPLDQRTGGYYTKRKGASKPDLIACGQKHFGFQELPSNKSDPKSFGKLMRETKEFLSYDAHTFLSMQAAACGSISIVVPDNDMPADKWYAQYPYGIAYGTEDKDLKHQRETLCKVWPWLELRERNSIDQVKNLLQLIQERF